MKWPWLLSLVPLAAMLGIAAFLAGRPGPLPVAFLRSDIATLLILLGVMGSLSAALVLEIVRRTRLAQRRFALEVQSKAAEDRRRFLSRLDHELKNPLTAIRAGLTNLAEARSEETRQQALSSVDAQALRLSRLSADLRKLADLETAPVERTPVDFAELLREAVGFAQESLKENGRHLTLTLPQAPWPLPSVDGDRDLLLLAVHNLLDNALKFTRPGDTVEVRGFEDGTSVVVEVADTGPGIPDAEVPHVWEELYRGLGARGIPGSGLGLALVRVIADRHEGKVSVRSREGKGTVFGLRLPAR